MTVHNRRDKTLACLKSIEAARVPQGVTADIFLTDDGCTDGTPEAVAGQFPQVHIVRGDGTLYWNRGMHKAWQEAAKTRDYDYYLWLNDDTMVQPNLFEGLLKASKSKADEAIIVGATQSSGRPTYGGRLKDNTIPFPNGNLAEVDHFNGNIVLIPRAVYKSLGNLDYYFTHSKGDFDYGQRARKIGIKIFQVGTFLGECDLHEGLEKWCNPEVPLRQRLAAMHRPNGMPPKETFHLERRHNGVAKALFHCCTIYLRCLFPKIWTKLNKAQLA